MLKQAITLDALEILDAIDRKGSFAAAANSLYKVPSAITYSVQKLEQDLGVTLFVKQGRSSVLTPAGNVLLEQGREILEAAERLTETTRQMESGWESVLNIAIDTAVGTQTIYPVLKKLFKIRPDIEVNLHQEALAGGWDALIESRADIAIGIPEKPSEISGYCCKPLNTSQWVFAVHKSHILSTYKQPLDQKDIECHRAVVVRDSSLNQAKLTHRLFSKHPVLSVQSLQDKISAQKSGLGVGFIPKDAIAAELASGMMVQLEVAEIDSQVTHHLAWRRGKKGKAVKWLIDQIIEQNA